MPMRASACTVRCRAPSATNGATGCASAGFDSVVGTTVVREGEVGEVGEKVTVDTYHPLGNPVAPHMAANLTHHCNVIPHVRIRATPKSPPCHLTQWTFSRSRLRRQTHHTHADCWLWADCPPPHIANTTCVTYSIPLEQVECQRRKPTSLLILIQPLWRGAGDRPRREPRWRRWRR